MPQAPKRPCSYPNCRALVEGGGRCPDHKQPETRGTSTHRGYDAAWQRFRMWFLRKPENALCADCQRSPARDVHHVKKVRDYPELKLVASNCMGLCSSCHSLRTAKGE